MALMLDRWEKVEEGHGQALLLSGEGGMGKSRLVQTLREQLAEESISWLECGCSPYHDKSAFHPVVELFEQGMLFRPDDPPEGRLEKLETGLRRLGFADPEDLLLLASLLSLRLPVGTSPLALSPEAQRRRTLELLATWIFALSEQHPVVLVVENLHWIDPSSLELLDLLIEQVPTAPVLLLLSFRPEFEAQWTLRSHLAHLTLHPLARREVEAMVAGITGGKALPAAVLDQVVKKTDGVPLFVEELTKSVLESGLLAEGEESFERTDPLPELSIPSTLQDSLMARLDRLGPAKEVAQLAAVLGRQFSFELLEAVSPLEAEVLESGLVRLVKAELLYRRGVPPRATYVFKHALVEDAAYQSLLRRARQQHHARIAQVLEERFPERVASDAEEMARHCERGDLAEKAISHYQRAAERAAERSAHAEAIGHLTRAIELVQRLPEGPERDQREVSLQVALGAPLVASTGFGGPDVEPAFARARILCEHLREGPQLADALSGLVTFYLARGQIEDAFGLAEKQLRLAERLQEPEHLVDAHGMIAAAHYFRGEPGKAQQNFDRANELYAPAAHRSLLSVRGDRPGVVWRQWSAWALWVRGYPDRSLEASREAITLARDAEHPFSLAYALAWASVVHFMRREREPAREPAEEAITIAQKQGFPLQLGVARLARIWATTSREQPEGAIDDALVEVQEVLAQLGAIGTQAAVPQILGGIADIYAEFERPQQAAGYVEAGLALSENTGQPYWNADLYRLKGEVALHREGGGDEEAESLFRRAVEIAASQEAKSLELRAATSLARLWHRQGRQREARDLLQPVCDWFTEGLDTQDLKDARALLEELA
jgi:tetratricopeptide (TPR) repeat protein